MRTPVVAAELVETQAAAAMAEMEVVAVLVETEAAAEIAETEVAVVLVETAAAKAPCCSGRAAVREAEIPPAAVVAFSTLPKPSKL